MPGTLKSLILGPINERASYQYERWCEKVFSSGYDNELLPKSEFHTLIRILSKRDVHECLPEGLSCRERKEKGRKKRAAKADLYEYSQSIFFLLQTRLLKKSISSGLLTQAGAGQGLLEQCQSQRH